MTDQPADNFDHLDLDADGRLDQDLICLKCGYNLRGLSPEGRCPECGTAVGRSLHGDRLQYCDPQWVDKLASGMNCVWWSLALLISTPVCLPLLILPTVWVLRANEDMSGITISCCYFMVTTLFWIIGIWRLATPDPIQPQNNNGIPRPQSIRYLLIPFSPLALAAIILLIYNSPDFFTIAFVMFVPLLLLLLLVVLSLRYAQYLARRGDNLSLAKSTRFARYGWCLGWLLVLIGALAQLATFILQSSTQSFSSFLEIIENMFFVGIILLVLFGLWLLHLVDKYYKLMQTSAKSARLTWAKEPFALVHPQDHR